LSQFKSTTTKEDRNAAEIIITTYTLYFSV